MPKIFRVKLCYPDPKKRFNAIWKALTQGLRISPHHIHRTKGEHKYAILLLARGISEILSDKELAPINLSAGLKALAERCEEDASRQKGY
jgi:hypothetical protein